MNKLIVLIFFIFISSCSKSGPESPAPALDTTTDSSETISLEALEKAKLAYESSKKKFSEMDQEKLLAKKNITEVYIEKAEGYLKLLKITSSDRDQISNITEDLRVDRDTLEDIENQIRKFNETKEDLKKSQSSLDELNTQTNDFEAELIRDQGLRDSLISEIENHNQIAEYLALTFENEFTDQYLESLKEEVKKLQLIKSQFDPYFQSLQVVEKSREALKAVDYSQSFAISQLRVGALKHEEKFFKALEEHLQTIDQFKSDAAQFLSQKDIESLEEEKLKISKALLDLNEIKTIQKQIQSDLSRIEYMGYLLPDDIENTPEEKLAWKSHQVFVFNSVLPKKVDWEPGLHRVNPLTNDNYPLEVITKYNLFERVTKKSYKEFDDAFGTSFTRIVLYLSKFEKEIPKEKDNYYFKVNLLLIDTYSEIDGYIDSLPF